MAGGGKGEGGGKKSVALAGDIGGGRGLDATTIFPPLLSGDSWNGKRKRRRPLVPHFKRTIKGEETMASSFAEKWLFLREENEEATSSSKNIVFALLYLSLRLLDLLSRRFPAVSPRSSYSALLHRCLFPPSEGSSYSHTWARWLAAGGG